MKVVLEKVGERNGKERFVLADIATGQVITKKDVSEPTMRKYLKGTGENDKLIDECLDKARKRFDKAQMEGGDEGELEDIFSEISLEGDGSDVH